MGYEDTERYFKKFMKRVEYEKAVGALSDVARAAFMAGWMAAEDQRQAKAGRALPGPKKPRNIKNAGK